MRFKGQQEEFILGIGGLQEFPDDLPRQVKILARSDLK
jgi:hypothetical protein